MRLDRALYRLQQFWQALDASNPPRNLDLVRQVLTPVQMDLFMDMQPSEQAHSLRVLEVLQSQAEFDPLTANQDLWVAALLHDVGKNRHPLRLWERVLIVTGKTIFPERARRWGADEQALDHLALPWRLFARLKRPFEVAEHHPEWGAQLAAEVGVSTLATSLIRKHQNLSVQKPVTLEEQLLMRLQAVDGSN